MSPLFASAITSSPAERAYSQTCQNARTPSAPCASKNADCGFTATACAATASTIPEQNSTRSPSTSGGISSSTGSSPTTSWLRLCTTASASRSEKCVTATVAIFRQIYFVGRNAEGPPKAALRRRGSACGSAVSDRRLQRTAGGELRYASCGDVHLFLRVARVDAHARLALLRLELSEPGKRDVAPAAQRVRDRVENRIDSLPCIARSELAPPGHLRDELLLGHEPLLLVDPVTLTGAISRAREGRQPGRAAGAGRLDARVRRLHPPLGPRRRRRCAPRARPPAEPRSTRGVHRPR